MLTRIRSAAFLLAALTACTGGSDDEDVTPPRDGGVARDGGTRDGGFRDGGVRDPDICDDLQLARVPWSDGEGGFEFGDVAGNFAVNTIDGRWVFEQEFTGCESYTFINYIPTNGTTEEELFASNPLPLLDAPLNAHFFFLSWERTPEDRYTRHDGIKMQIDRAIEQLDPEMQEKQRRRFHYVLDSVLDIPGSVGLMLLDYTTWSADQASWVDLGDRGRAPAPALFAFGIDRDQQWDSGGSMSQFVGGTAAFQMAGFLPLFYDHKASIRDAQAVETGVETFVLLDERTADRELVRTADLPDAAAMAGYDTLEVDVTVNCPHRNPFACSEWDRIAHVFVCLDSMCMERRELVRWITPYWRRGTRRWVMDASALMGLVAAGGTQTFQVVTGPTWERATERDVRVAIRLSNQGKGARAVEAVRAFTGGQFNDMYNMRDPFSFTPPSDATRVELVLILSGHGQAGMTNCSEWCDHRHQFGVNGTELPEIRHEGDIGSAAGCGPAAAFGVSPGQWGNWAPERAYWCPGLPVDHIVVDITDQVTLGQANELTYSGNYRGGAPGGGNISLTSYVTWVR